MGKYRETAKIMFKTQMAYRFDILVNILFSVSKILLAYVLWRAVFGSRDEVAGFTFDTMLAYYILNAFINQLDQSGSTGRQIADEIRNGRFSKYIVRPIGLFRYFSAQTAGLSAFLLGFSLLAAAIWTGIFRVEFKLQISWMQVGVALLLVLLGVVFMMQLNYFIGILAFKFLDTSLFMMIKDNIVQFITGSLIPLTLLPAAVIEGMRILPFYYISYLPTMLLLGREADEAVMGIAVLAGWNGAFALVNRLTYRRLRSRYDGVGI